MANVTTWKAFVTVDHGQVDTYEEALGNLAVAVSSFGEPEGGPWVVSAVFDQQPDTAELEAGVAIIAAAMGWEQPPLTVEEQAGQDWLANSLHSFQPVDAGRFFIYGSHYESPPPPGRIGLQVNAATAFGSGEHATTKGCLLALDGLAKKRFIRPLDMGCGSAILAMAMARVWGRSVVACDIDAESVRVAKLNARLNRVGAMVQAWTGNGYQTPEVRQGRPYDLIVANILLRPLCRMARDLSKNLASGGYVVLSGFLGEDTNRIVSVHRRFGLKLVAKYPIGDWQTVVLRR
jgi:ribosomal protein L11 methyltransferase